MQGQDEGEQYMDYSMADIPDGMKGIRACLRCTLLKTFEQFTDAGCENCEFLGMEGNSKRVQECTTSYFEGILAIAEPQGSWVAKWQRIANHEPGMYAIEVVGELPDDVIEYCENRNLEIKCNKSKVK